MQIWSPSLSQSSYLRRRLDPSIRDIDYLPLRDLYAVLKLFAQFTKGRVFDYGCGGCPYRHLFTHCEEYVGGDIVAGAEVKVLLSPDGQTGQDDDSYETVLSSQVLEHVKSPNQYLAEAYRILAPGGKMILTTHGMFLEHGCPYDFHRWTGAGLESQVQNAGFEILDSVKITPGIRASAHLVHTAMASCAIGQTGFRRTMSILSRRIYAGAFRALFNSIADRFDPRSHVPTAAADPIYIGVGVLARKPCPQA